MALDIGGILGGLAQTILPGLIGPPALPGPRDLVRTTRGPQPNGVEAQRIQPLAPIMRQVTAGRAPAPEVNTVLDVLLSGGSDSMVRSAARAARVGKRDLIEALMNQQTFAGASLTGFEKQAISSEIERIFRRRRRGPIPKSLVRAIKQIRFIKSKLGFIFK